MRKFFVPLFLVIVMPAFGGDCGPGYILVDHAKVDGIRAMECQKLWCRDLETNKNMGSGNRAASGYVDTSVPNELCDATGKCIECFGDRKWCSGAAVGVWNPEYGAYTQGGADSATYRSALKTGCFSWQLQKPKCDEGLDAILKDGEWICAIAVEPEANPRQSAIRRTSATRRATRATRAIRR